MTGWAKLLETPPLPDEEDEVQELTDRLKISYRHADLREPGRVERRLEIDVTDHDLVSVTLGVADSTKIAAGVDVMALPLRCRLLIVQNKYGSMTITPRSRASLGHA
ncbi:MAG: hypothetical protein ABIR55_04575 [Burkholderiaceae bacterium]